MTPKMTKYVFWKTHAIKRVNHTWVQGDPEGAGTLRKCTTSGIGCRQRNIAELLLRNGATVNAQGGCFIYAFQVASYYGHGVIVKTLLRYGAVAGAQHELYSGAS